MDLDALLLFYFGTLDLDTLDQAAIDEGVERAAIAFATERESGRRFALWTVLHAFDRAPDPEAAFKDRRERKAAEDYAWAAARIGRG